jgi:hypothetical protein
MAVVKIHLDYANPPNAIPSWTFALLLASTVLVSVMGSEYLKLESERTDLRARMLDGGAASHNVSYAPPRSPEAQKALREQVLQANAVLGELGRPWPALFLILEGVAQPEIALLAIRPDAVNERLRIAGEARTMTDALNYVRKLATSEQMTDVVLEEHEVVASDQQRPVRFALSARWTS